ncbi:MAG: histone deacetylase [Thermodesulfobacteriota bacterium]
MDHLPSECRPTDGCSRRTFLTTASSLALGLCAWPLPALPAVKPFSEGKDRSAGTGKRSAGTGLVLDERYTRHLLGRNHPESPERLKAIERRLEATGLAGAVVKIAPSVEAAAHIRAIHPESHIRLVGRQARDESICRLAVSGCLDAVDAVCTGRAVNAFCAVRPPGHHAADRGEYGFCFYNNIAVAARYAQRKHGLAKILIVDWDYHHGDGTEWAFYADPTVLFFSTHALYAFPGTGFAERTGSGAGKGFNINVPMPRGTDDKAILDAFHEHLVPAAERFRPDLVMISAGFDSRKDDPLGDFAITDGGFTALTRLMMSIASAHCGSRIVSILEGGYNTEGLALAVESHIRALLGHG